MGGRSRNVMVVGLMLSVFLISLGSPLVDNTSQDLVFEDESVSNVTPTGQSNIVSIGSYPDGVNDAISINVPSGEAVTSIDLSLDENVLPVSAAKVWDSSQQITIIHKQFTMESMSMELVWNCCLKDGHIDMEGTNAWTFSGTNAWFWGFDSSLGSTNGVTSGSKALYTYNGNYPTYMGGPYWATSPVMNCGGCSGGWDLKFQKRLGVESSSYDHAYVSVKNNAGNWVNVWSNSGTVNDGSYTTQTITISNYVAGNSNFQVRFGLGSSDGSVQYYWMECR